MLKMQDEKLTARIKGFCKLIAKKHEPKSRSAELPKCIKLCLGKFDFKPDYIRQ